MSEFERRDCKHIFSNGTEFELFVEQYCCKCSRYRNGKCRIYTAIIKAMFDEKYFPYKDLWEYEGIGGKGCKSFTEDPCTTKTKRTKRNKRAIENIMNDYIKRLFLKLACLHDFETVSPLENIGSSFMLKCRKCGKNILQSDYWRYEL